MRTHIVEHRTITTYEQLVVTLRTYHEMLDAGIPKNWCVRTLNMVVDTYSSQCHRRGQAIPVSKAAAGLSKDQLIYEHGTPLSLIVAMFIEAYKEKGLTEPLAREIAKLWRVAYVTKAEDQKLRDLGLRSKMTTTGDRWAAAGIEF